MEVDSSYYAIPDARTSQLWTDRTPERFVFHVKAYGALTGHAVEPKSLPVDIAASLPKAERDKKHVYIKEAGLLEITAERFRDALKPLAQAKKLGVVVFQFPPWFQCRRSNLDYLLKVRDMMGGLSVAVEFRHGSWLTPEKRTGVIGFLREHSLIYVVADEPQYGSLATVPFLPDSTASVGYFRFHGRNKENWLRKGIETSLRFDYEYSGKELKEFVPAIKAVETGSKETYVMFNNCHGAKAVRNARKMQGMIT